MYICQQKSYGIISDALLPTILVVIFTIVCLRANIAVCEVENFYFNPDFKNNSRSHIEKVAVLPFTNCLGVTSAEAVQIRDIFTAQINKYHLYELIPYQNILEGIKSIELEPKDAPLQPYAQKIGETVGADGVVTGTVSEYIYKTNKPPRIGIVIRFVNISNGNILWSYLVQYKREKQVDQETAFSLINSELLEIVYRKIVMHDENKLLHKKKKRSIAYGYNLKDLIITPSFSEIIIECPLLSEVYTSDIKDGDFYENLERYYIEKSKNKTGPYEIMDDFSARRKDPIRLEDDEIENGHEYYYRYYITNNLGLISYKTKPQKVLFFQKQPPATTKRVANCFGIF